jgi:hypothetical protein
MVTRCRYSVADIRECIISALSKLSTTELVNTYNATVKPKTPLSINDVDRTQSDERVFVGIFPTGVSYADRKRQVAGDYARLAFLSFDTLELTFQPDCPQQLRQEIIDDAATIQARKGEQFETSACGQTVLLGHTK